MQTHNLRHRGGGVALIALTAGLYIYASQHPKTAPHAASQATASHIIDMTEPLCRTLVPKKNTLHFAARPCPTYGKSGAPRDLWTVECSNNEGKEIVHVLWDEDNKRCVSISQPQSFSQHDVRSRLNDKAALDAARTWVMRLNIAAPIQAANAPSTLRNMDDSYRVFLRLPDGLATVWIDAHTGECFNALVRSYPDTATMQAASPSKQNEIPHS